MTSSSFRLLTVATFLSLGMFTAASCGKSGEGLVRVGRSTITEQDLDTLGRVNQRLKPRLSTPQGRQKVLENYIEQEILYQEAVNRGLNRSTELKEKIALYEKIFVAQALLDQELEKKVKDYYDANKGEFERVKVAHILIKVSDGAETKPDVKKPGAAAKPVVKRSEADALKLAMAIRDRVAKGEDFGKVAKEVSEDDRTKGTLGDLGYISLKDKRLERWGWLPLAEKTIDLKAGEISEPIRTKDGFHIVKVLEEKKAQSYEEAESGIKFRLQVDLRTQLLDELKKKYKVEYLGQKAAAEKVRPAPETTPAPETAPSSSPAEESSNLPH
jgi:parvulin-like peptidyl-prolyl isomerase